MARVLTWCLLNEKSAHLPPYPKQPERPTRIAEVPHTLHGGKDTRECKGRYRPWSLAPFLAENLHAHEENFSHVMPKRYVAAPRWHENPFVQLKLNKRIKIGAKHGAGHARQEI